MLFNSGFFVMPKSLFHHSIHSILFIFLPFTDIFTFSISTFLLYSQFNIYIIQYGQWLKERNQHFDLINHQYKDKNSIL